MEGAAAAIVGAFALLGTVGFVLGCVGCMTEKAPLDRSEALAREQERILRMKGDV